MKLSGWGRFPVVDVALDVVRDEGDVVRRIGAGGVIARGNGRAYGDSALNPAATLDMRRMNRMLAFDPASGQLVAESGLLLADLIDTFLPRGWFPFVTPGTRFVTLGGMIAADVHGKNHHRDGSIGRFVDWIDLACADGVVRRCSPTEHAELFCWTIGGMGLTGVILRAAIRLRRVETGWIRQRTLAADNLAAVMRIFEQSQDATYSVAWIDCGAGGQRRGRSIVMLGEHGDLADLPPPQRADRYAARRRRSLTMPIDLPSGALNRWTVGLFNAAYFRHGRSGAGERWVDWRSYFYPLDAILHWNRIYGRRGFAQFQCVLPLETATTGLDAMLAAIAEARSAPFLSVLKRFGAESAGLSFPMPGYTLALDFPVSPGTMALMERLDAIMLAAGGRFYLAKDSRMTAATAARADARTIAFRKMREMAGMVPRFRSRQSERLGL